MKNYFSELSLQKKHKKSISKKIFGIFLFLIIVSSKLSFGQGNTPCAAAALPVNAGCVNTAGTTVGATYASNAANGGVPTCSVVGAPDVWYSIVAPASGSVTITMSGGGGTPISDGAMALYNGPCGGPTQIACNDDFIGLMPQITQSGLTPGVTYYVRIWAYGGTATGTFNICAVANPPPPPPPANDNACGATPLTPATACSYTAGTTSGATQSQPGCVGTANDDVWYSFVAAGTSQTITVAASASFDPVVEVFSGTCAGLTTVNCNDFAYLTGSTGGNTVTGLTIGQTYWVRIYDYGAGVPATTTFNICITTPAPLPPGPYTCATADPFCTATGVNYPATTGASPAPAGANYGCLFSEPNPAFYYLNIATSGNINIALASTPAVDIDFACWGPFASQAAMCGAIYAAVPPAPISCSYSVATTETVVIPGAVAGQWYMVMITNFSNTPTNISATAAAGTTGSTNCAILCNMTALTGVPSACVPATNTYSVSGTISVTNPPSTGTLTITSSCGGSTTVSMPWSTSINYTLPGLTPTGGACNLTAVFSADPTCTLTIPYTSPPSCACSATATNTGPYCAGATIQLNATGGGTYSWSGPGAFSSTLQNPTRPVSTIAMSGTYTVTVTAGGGATCTATTTVTVNPVPVIIAPANISVCAGAVIAATTITSVPAGATYTWTNSNTGIGLVASGIGQVPAFTSTNASAAPISGTITITPTLGGCVGTPVTYTITINPQPTSTYTQSANQCLTGNSFVFTNTGLYGSTYSWTFPSGTPATSTAANPTVTWATPGTYTITHVTTAAGGCTSTSTSTVTIYPAPTALAVTAVNATCGASNGIINIGAVTGGTAPYSYSVNGSAFSGTLSYPGFAPGTYTVIVKDANGCTFTTTVTVANSPGPTALVVTNVSTTCGLSNGIINIGTTTGGTGPYTYSVNGSAFTGTTSYSGFAAGTYTVIVHDVNGCAFTTSTTLTNIPGPTGLTVTTVNSTCGNANGVINMGAVIGGTAPYTYSVNGSAYTGTLSYTGFAAGTYTVIVKDANGCSFTTTTTVVNTPGPTALATTHTNATCGSSTGTITMGAVTGGVGPYTYSVNASAFTGTTTYSGFAAGTYTVIVKDANGCTFTTSVTITNSSGPTALAVTSTNSTCGAANGTATIGAVTGGVAPYTYSFNGSAFTATTNYTLLAAGTYSVVVKDINGCTFTTSITIVNTAGPTALAVTSVNSTCGIANGIINIGAVTGGTAPYTYSVNASAFTGTLSYSGFAAGTYTVIVKDANGCTFTTSITVTNTPGPTALAVTVVNATCGASNGVINIGAVTGGSAAYTYSVNASAFTATTSYTGFAAGTYTVIVKDANGCTFSTTATIINIPGPTAVATTTINSTCGAANGTVNIGAVTGGTAAFVYSFNGSPFTATLSYTGLAAGTYTIIVKDANGCTFTTTATVTNSTGPTALATTITNAACGASTGTITIGATTGGTAAYTYSVNGSAFTATTSYSGFAAGTYSVVVKDANGCTFTTSITIVNSSGPTALAVSSTNASCGSSTGTATIGAVTGGIAAYTYSFNGSPFTSTTSYTGLASGTYTVIVKDANGCTFTTTVTVGSNAAPTALATSTTNSTCGAANGVITIGAVTGGIAPYTYSVNASPFTTTTIYGALAAGTYTVIVKDVNGCTFTATATIINSPGATALAVTTVNSTCGATNGVINIGSVTGGSPAYSYSVNGSPFTTTTSYTGFGSGTYTVIVKDANGCPFTTTATVVNTPGPTALAATSVNSTCGNANGSVTIGAVTGGTAAFVYSFNGSPFTGTLTYSGLAAGTYTIIVKDANGCTFTRTIVVTNTPGPTALATTFANPTCGNSNGTITIGATTGGVGPFTYSFNGGGFTVTTNYTGLSAGTYTIIVQDANGCQFTITRTITNVPGPTAQAASTTNTACGGSTGTITIGATTGGTAAYTYSVNGSPFTATTSYTGFAANTYPVIVQDANGCQFATTATVANSTGPTALVVNTTNAACGASSGTITIGAVTGGLAPFSYSVNASAFTATTSYTGFAAGTYVVVVKDANGCTFSTTAIVNPTLGPTALVVTNTNATCGASNGTINIGAVTGGTAAYSYSVNASAFTTTVSYTGFAAGTYTVIVKDANGCTFTTTTTIINVPGPTAIATTLTNTTCGTSNGSVVLGAVTGGTPGYTYSFNGSAFTATTTYSALAAGTYTIIVKDANGCTYTTTVTLTNTAGPTALATTFTNPTCGNSNGTITIGAVTGGTPTYTYSFNGGGFTATTSYTGLAAGAYPIIVQDANGCQFTISRVITNVPGPTALATTTTNASCGASNGTATIGATTGGTAPYTYSFNGSPFTATTSYTGLAANSYPVIVQDANGCQFTTAAVVVNSSGPTALAVTHTDATCGASNGTVTIGGTTGGVLPLSYSFNAGAFSTTTSYTGLAAGTYTVIVKDANGCTFTTTVTIANIAGSTALAVTNTPTTCGTSNGTLTIGTVTGGTATYTYSVNASAFTATTSYPSLVSGTYTIVVKDANGCTFTTTSIITNTPGPTAIATTITNTTCGNSNGSVVLGAVTGGTSAYTYSFNGSPFTASTNYTGLAAGTYAIIVKDANGCTFTTSAVITNTAGPTALATTFTNPTCGNNNGTITIGAVTGGTPSYTYSFNGGGFTAVVGYTGLAAGTYPIIVQDANGCQFTTSRVIVNVPGPTALATTTTNASCGSSNGTATIGATTGGTAPYTYSFNGSAFTATTSYTGLAANSYPVIVQDANGCQFTTTAIVVNSTGPTALVTTHTDATCGNSNGTVTIGATTGGVLPLSYSFNAGGFSTTTSYTGLAAGTYAVIVKDANGCTFTTSVTISNIPGPTAMVVTNTNTTCGASNGTLTIGAITGGTTPYTYSVNASAFTITTSYAALAAGTYTVVVKDANGCTFTTTSTIVNIPGPTAVATTLTNTTCGNSNGAVAIGVVTGGTPAYTYSFNGSPFTATISYTGLAAGSYTIIVKDANGCTFTTSVNLTNTPGPTAQATTINPSTCGLSNGAVNIAATTGGTPPYTFSFNGGGFTGTTIYTGLLAGTYAVIVKDANGCTFTVNPVVTNVAGPAALATTITNSTCGGANGAILIGATTGGTPPYLYSVNGSVLSATTNYTGLVANSYTVVVQDANGCQFTSTVTVSDLSGLIASITAITNVSCFGGTNGSVTVTASGSLAPYSYSLNGGLFGASGTFSGLTQGVYTVVAKDGNGCTVSIPVTISQPSVLVGVLVSQTNVLCFGGTTGAATVSASGGTTPYTYSIDLGPFVASPIFTGLAAGTHTITIKDGNGCTVIVTVTITQPPVLALTTSVVNAVCTAANGSATVTPTGGTPNYSYLWTPGGITTATDAGITAGNYTVLVTDFNGCTQTTTVSVGSNPGATAVISSSANVSCTGANDGSATVSMGAGATPPFTYAWTPGSQTTVTATGLAPGTYNVTVTDGNGCISTANVTITQPTILAQTFTTTNVSCFGGSNGLITINPSGGTPGYTYFWTPGSFTTQTISSLTAGTYTCVFTDANGCSHTASTIVTQPTGMTLTETHTDANCSLSNGSATVAVTGGTGPYTYSWSTVPVQTTASAAGLAANTYVVTVTDGNGCAQTLSVIIGNLAGPVASIFSSINVSCNGNNDGAATVTVAGGVIPFSFLWSNGQTLPTTTNLTAGTYTLVATDVNGCIASTSVTITEPTVLNLGVTGTDPTCFNACNGTLTSTPTGGTTPYSYLWSPGGMTTQNVTGLCAGTYTLQVIDAHGCIVFKPYTLNNPGAVTATTATTNVTCSGLCNGASTGNPLTGTGPFTYAWNDINAQTTQTATGLCAGSYTVTVTDANGCTATATSTVTSPASMTVAITTQGNNTCFNACDGFATAAVTGGSAPFSYNWMPGATAGAAVNNLCAGTYTVTVTDLNGCSANTTVNITQPTALVATITSTNVTCFGACNGTANAVYTGGTGPYTFQWTPTFQTTPNIASICAGVYNLSVTDGNGCIATASAVITEPSVLAVTTTTTPSSCGNADGSACAAITGGVPPFTYSWNDPSNQATSCAFTVNAGVYTISVTDGNGCSVTNVANVNDLTAPVVTIPTSANVTCFGASNGNAQANIVGGVVPYNILWTPTSATSAFISSLSGGIYSVVVTDSIGCVGTASVTIGEPATLVSGVIASTNVSCFLSCNGSATVSAGGGTTPYTYLWNDAATQTTTTATGLCAASYTATVTDANGCVSNSSQTITQPPAINISIVSTTNVTCNGGNDGAITISVTGGTPGYTYLWTPSVGSGPSVTGLTAGAYTVKVTDQNGCASIITIIVTQPTAITLSTITNPSTCGNSNGFVSVTPLGGTPGYTYSWNTTPTQTTAIATSLAAGTYVTTVTDNHGCIATTSVVLTNVAGPTISAIPFTEPLCYGTPLGTATVLPIGGTPIYTFLWSGVGAQITQTATALTTGVYSVVVTDQNGCTATGSVNVTQPNPLVVIPSPTDTICIGANAQIYGAGYGGTPGYTYTWTPSTLVGAGPIVVNPVIPTTYDVFVTDANGCISPSQPVTIFVNPPITVVATDVSVCFGSSVPISALANGGNGGPYTYSWAPSAGLSSTTAQNPTATPLVTTNYIVSVDDGCTLPSYSAFDTATVTVNPLAISIMLANDTAGCEDFTVVFNAVSDIGVNYSWNFGDGSPSLTGEPVTYTYPNPGSYNVTLTVTTALGCVSSITNNNYIDVFPSPIAAFTYSPSTITQTAPEVTFTDGSTGETTWAWDFDYPSGGTMDTLQNPVYSYADSGSYVVQLIVTNNLGCADTAYNNLYVVPEYVLYAPNAFTPTNHDGLNDTFIPQGVGIDPNHFEMFIFDRWGNQIFKTTDVNKGWDGHANGGANVAQIDVYVWKINTKDSKANDHHYVGTVTLVK
jgi:gliding motility-associated-like protein